MPRRRKFDAVGIVQNQKRPIDSVLAHAVDLDPPALPAISMGSGGVGIRAVTPEAASVTQPCGGAGHRRCVMTIGTGWA